MDEQTIKVAIYCRLSEEDRNKRNEWDDSESIKNQKALLSAYAAEHHWQIYDIYSDDDYTGSDRNRPEFLRLLQDAENGRFRVVLCKTQSRFTREMELVEKYIHGLFPLWGIRFISVVDNADTDNKGNKKARQINGLINEWYLEDMSDNIKSILTHRRQQGYHIGSFPLYGYRKDPKQKGHLIPDPEAANIVQHIFQQYADGCGKNAIAKKLNTLGIPNPTVYQIQAGLRSWNASTPPSSLWNYHTIASMLKNEMYIGTMVQGRYGSISYKTKQNRPRPKSLWYTVPNTHTPIISIALWEQVQARLSAAAQTVPSDHALKPGIFAGKAYCLYCHRRMRSTKSHGKSYLKCATHTTAPERCVGSFIATDALYEAIENEIIKNVSSAVSIAPEEIHNRLSVFSREEIVNHFLFQVLVGRRENENDAVPIELLWG